MAGAGSRPTGSWTKQSSGETRRSRSRRRMGRPTPRRRRPPRGPLLRRLRGAQRRGQTPIGGSLADPDRARHAEPCGRRSARGGLCPEDEGSDDGCDVTSGPLHPLQHTRRHSASDPRSHQPRRADAHGAGDRTVEASVGGNASKTVERTSKGRGAASHRHRGLESGIRGGSSEDLLHGRGTPRRRSLRPPHPSAHIGRVQPGPDGLHGGVRQQREARCLRPLGERLVEPVLGAPEVKFWRSLCALAAFTRQRSLVRIQYRPPPNQTPLWSSCC